MICQKANFSSLFSYAQQPTAAGTVSHVGEVRIERSYGRWGCRKKRSSYQIPVFFFRLSALFSLEGDIVKQLSLIYAVEIKEGVLFVPPMSDVEEANESRGLDFAISALFIAVRVSCSLAPLSSLTFQLLSV